MLDGEVAILDRQLRSRFDWLRDPDPEEVGTPPLLMVFDLLHRTGRDQAKRPLRERRARLEEIWPALSGSSPCAGLTSNGLVAWGEVLQAGFEGYIAKDEASPYVGGVTKSWLKVKLPGWTYPEDRWRRVRLDIEGGVKDMR